MKKIGIAGAGGIGSNVAMLLVRAGVKALKIADFDHIEESNLNRQFYFYHQIGENKVKTLAQNLLSINPEVAVETVNLFITPENIAHIFSDCDIIVEGFDKASEKKMLLEIFAEGNRSLYSACGIAGLSLENVRTLDLAQNIHIIGDFESEICSHSLYSPKVMLVASIMAQKILQELHHE